MIRDLFRYNCCGLFPTNNGAKFVRDYITVLFACQLDAAFSELFGPDDFAGCFC